MKIYLIRHGITQGNLEQRYVGQSDIPLCEQGIEALRQGSYPPVDAVYASPLQRALQTAAILYPDQPAKPIEKLKEIHFGIFENRHYSEMRDCQPYRDWLDSQCTTPIPGGESFASFTKRSLEGFGEVIKEALAEGNESIAIVAHGGTIRSILMTYVDPQKGFYDWQIDNGAVIELEDSICRK
ncbi:MAG: histidine phosphatase family protein [Lachnospiraceae bacterium]|nr:histidine phosphatase family protein [Lachnospiraceae bacterium]MDY5741558.1 histidine phosphatase family protein [Lachnospiraceae bacterium]